MQRRRLLALLAGTVTTSLTGCNWPRIIGMPTETAPRTSTAKPADSDVCIQSFVERTRRLWTATAETPSRFTARDRRQTGTRATPSAEAPRASKPMRAAFPPGRTPEPEVMPGTHLGTARSGEAVFEAARLPDSTLGYHYGTVLPTRSGADRLRLTVATPPQVGCYEGYERAFLKLPPTELSI